MKKVIIFLGLFQLNTLFGQNNIVRQDSINSSVDTTIYTVVTSMPQYGKEKSDLQDFIVKASKLPAQNKRTGTTKNVFVQIIIEKDGKVKFDKIAKGQNDKLDNEAKRIAESMPNWTPGKMENGAPVRVKMMFPIWFE